MSRINVTRNFYEDEFACKCGCGLKDIDSNLAELLQLTRDEYGSPMKITSGLRCKTWNSACGGSENSSHLIGKAVDIEMDNSILRYRLIRMLQMFFKRIGIAKTFIHVDVDHIKTNPVIWTY